MDSWFFNLKTIGDFKLDFQRKSSSLSFNGEGLGLLNQSLRLRYLFLSKRASIYRPMRLIFAHFYFWQNIKISLACLHGRVIGPSSDALRSKIECKPCWNHVVKPFVYEKWNLILSKWSFTFNPYASHSSFSKWYDFGIFGKVRSRGTTFMLNTFSFEAWIMMNFKVEVWKIKHIKKSSKY